MSSIKLTELLNDVRACTLCQAHLPHGPRPVVQAHPDARILIAGQAPGNKAHRSGIPFDDPHPSPQNNIWPKKNPWFDEEVVPVLRARVRQILLGEPMALQYVHLA